MLHHPVLLVSKAVVIAVVVAVLIILHGVLAPEQFVVAVVLVSLGGLLAIVGIWVLFARMMNNPNSKLAQQMTLAPPTGDKGHVTEIRAAQLAALVGAEGLAESALRPSGIVRIGDERIQVVTEATFIDKGARVRVVGVTGTRVKVKPVE